MKSKGKLALLKVSIINSFSKSYQNVHKRTCRSRSTINYEERIFKNELILNCILKQLTPKQLKSVSRVNKIWNNRCNKLLRQKNSTLEDLFLIFGVSKHMKNNQERYSKIILAKDVENFEKLKEGIVDYFENHSKTVPSIALLFHTFRRMNQKHYSSFVNNKLLKLLPHDCSIMNLRYDSNFSGTL